MIEVLFGESEAASMKAAKSKVVRCLKSDGPISVWIAGKKGKPEEASASRKFSGWVEGTAEEVVYLGFQLDMGDILQEPVSHYRSSLLYSLYFQEQWGAEEAPEELRELLEQPGRELKRLMQFLDQGEKIRIWYSQAPYSICGFYHLCSILSQYPNPVEGVRLPEYRCGLHTITSYQSWGEVAAEEFAGFLQDSRPLSREELRLYALHWRELQQDNSPLRAVVNGRVMGVPEDFYDFLIWREIGQEPEKQARIIGRILGHSRIAVGDWWYAKRIQEFLDQGKLKVIRDSERKYERMIASAAQ